jgi:hypothetical protein
VLLVLREDDGLAQPVAAGDLVAVGHQRREHLVDGVLVEQELVELLGADGVRRPVLAPLERVPLVLLVVAEVVVADPRRTPTFALGGTLRVGSSFTGEPRTDS